MAVARLAQGVRPLRDGDIPQIAQLYARIFGPRPAAALLPYLRRIFCDHPWRDPTIPSLVWEAGGRILGCLGVMPRPMSFDGRPIRAAVSHSFMVEPAERSTLAAVELVKAYRNGPQDVSLAEGNDTARRIWEGLGGSTVLLYSLRWIRPIRPIGSLVWAMRGPRRAAPRAIPRIAADLLDAAAARLPGTPFHRTPPRAGAAPLDAPALLAAIDEVSKTRRLRPAYDRRSVEWLLGALGSRSGGGMRLRSVREGSGRLLGWYLYHVTAHRVAEVAQFGASPEAAPDVLDALRRDAWAEGAVAVSAPLDPALIPALARARCLFTSSGSWLLASARDPVILEAILRGDAFLTRLEGEGWIPLAL